MNLFICPVCGEILIKKEKSYVCSNNHCFDIAKSGYLNLLLSKNAGKSVHGDNKLMVRARKSFLDKDFYLPLRDALCKSVVSHLKNDNSVILDAGCGEGYYTSGISELLLKNEKTAELFGIDISKAAVEYAAKRCKSVSFAAASVFHIPAADSSCDILITLFAPYCGEEFRRILKNNGIMIMAIPSVMHLWELKQAIYDKPYKNEVKPYELDGFSLIEKQHINYKFQLDNTDDIMNLFSMTPYYYTTGKVEQERLAKLTKLNVQADFELLTYLCERNDKNGA